MIDLHTVPQSATETLDGFFADGRRPHAVLVDGAGEYERVQLALRAAQMLVCRNTEQVPCGMCENCRKAEENIHPDIIIAAKPDDKKYFVKADVKKIVADAYLTPNEAAVKVYILKEVQQMNEECQNLLLKILEEPPRYTAFVLTAQSANAVIGTVLSRVVRLRLGKSAQVQYSEKAEEVARKFIFSLLSPYEYDRVAAVAPIDGNKPLIAEFLSILVEILRDAAVFKAGGKPLLEKFLNETQKLAAGNDLKKLTDMYDTAASLLRSLENNPNYTLLGAVLCASI